MKKRFLTGRGLLAATVLAAGGGGLALWAGPASAAGTPQISVVTGHAGSAGVPTLGHPKVAATAGLSAGYVAYDPANGDEAVSVVTQALTTAHVYLIAGADEPNEYHIETATGTYGALVQGDAYLVAGNGTDTMVADPGGGTTIGQSTTGAATANGISPVSLAFDNQGNLLIAESHPNTGPTRSGIQIVAKTSCATDCAYGYGAGSYPGLTAGNLYTIAGVGSWTGITTTSHISYTFQVAGFGMAVDSSGDIVVGANGNVLFLNETGSSISRYGATLAAHHASKLAGTATSGSATCGDGSKSVPALGASAPNLEIPHPYIDAHGNVYVNDNSATDHLGCTWVLPAATGTLDGQTMTAGHLYSLTGAATTTAATDGAVADTTSFPVTSTVAVDPAGNVVLGLSGTTPTVRVIAERTGTYYGQPMTAGDVYTIAGGGSRTTPGSASGFEFGGAARTASLPEYGLTSLTTGGTGDLLLTDGSTATTETAYQVTGAPTPVTPTVTSVSPSSGTTAGGTHVTITGTNLTGATVVKFGTTSATTVVTVNSTTVTAHTPPHAAVSVSVSVTGTDGTGSKASAFTYATPSTTLVTLSASPTGSQYYGTTVTLTAHTTPTSVAGKVQFLTGATVIGTRTASGGTATFSTAGLAKGAHSLTAKFVPTSTLYDSSTSTPAVSYTIKTAPGIEDGVDQPFAETVTAGQLTLSCLAPAATETAATVTCPLITLTPVTLSGVTQTESKLMNPVYVYTARGTDTSGWSLSASMVPTSDTLNTNTTCGSSADFCDSSAGTHATLAAHGQVTAKTLALAGYTCTPASTNTNPTPAIKTSGAFSHTLALCAATAGTSQGVYKVSGGTYTLTIPSTILHGLYYGTVEYLLVSTT